MENLSCVALLFQISENLLEFNPFKHVMRVPNLHMAPKRHLIKIRIFLKKIDSYLENISLQDVLKGLDHIS